MGAVSVRNLEALTKLAWKLVLRAASRPFVRPAKADAVLAAYAADGVALVTAKERAAAPFVRRCTGCGRCDGLDTRGPAPSLLVLRLGREGQDAKIAEGSVDRLRPIAKAILQVCPERVDVPAMIAAIDRRAAR
ncbi:MAG: hypothetical protein IT381_00900 [Deltaproteobacteria bacterium]|nr:hypothetical protein [Deltaproteobacteria bacterium]